MSKREIVLASSSKRRARILKDCGFDCRVVKSKIEEVYDKRLGIIKLVELNAKLKAENVAKRLRKKSVVLGVDTLVLLGKSIIGKPANQAEAQKLLKRFSSKKILVYSGLHLIDQTSESSITEHEKTTLWVSKIKASQINKYLKHLGPYDKAGGFSIEGLGSVLFDHILGSYFNVLGLPISKLSEMISKIGIDIFDFILDNR